MRYLLLAFLLLAAEPIQAQVAVYRGRAYTSRVCSNPGCAMCSAIQQQLTIQRTRTVVRQPVIVPAVAAVAAVPVVVAAKVAAAVKRVAVTERVPVMRRVKVCHGTWCEYVMQATYELRTTYKLVPVEPAKAEPKLEDGAAQAPTPYDAVAELMEIIQPKPGDVVYDLGCGDGRVLIAASLRGAKSVGIELDAKKADEAQQNARVFGVDPLVKIYTGDVLSYDLTQCRIVTLYLYPDLLDQVVKKLPAGCRVYSYLHGLPGAKRHQLGDDVFYELTIES